MRLITRETELEKEFIRLVKQYDKFYWATAWAGIKSSPFEELKKQQEKIKRLIVGIHFYQTHPDFISYFLNHKEVRYVLQPSGTFHPKIYLFENNKKDWELLIGSGNFTSGAFNTNMEATLLVSKDDINSASIYSDTKALIEELWKDTHIFSEPELESYRTTWKNMRPKRNSLSGKYGRGTNKKRAKPIHTVSIIIKTWKEFISEVKSETSHGVERRLRVIEIANQLFSRVEHFSDLETEERKFIAGIPNKYEVQGAEDWGYFGSMKGAGIFKNRIIGNDNNISKALDQIPKSGQITRKHYERFIKFFQRAFLSTRLETANNLSTASRLLALKRPDVFVCYDDENKGNLSRDFGISQSNMNYDRYWDDVIERIYDSEWWLNPEPINNIEERVSNARAAFLDALYYTG